MEIKWIKPSNPVFDYTGRIDFDNTDAPVLVYACSSIGFRTNGRTVTVLFENKHSYYENSIGVAVNGEYRGKIILHDGERTRGETLDEYMLRVSREDAANIREDQPEEQGEKEGSNHDKQKMTDVRVYDLTPFLDGKENEILLFKRMDACHYVTFLGLIAEEGTIRKSMIQKPARRIEVYGDSVSCGEVSEAVGRCGMDDPEGHNGIYSNSFYSYPWILARKMGASIHDISQGGISLFDGEGYFDMPCTKGMLSCYDKINYNPSLGEVKKWDFQKYTPHVVIIAIGQNDAHPANYMVEDFHGEQSVKWRKEYMHFIERLRSEYPNALIVLTTTILGHDKAWDEAIELVVQEMNDPKVVHFLYSNNGCGTSGHVRIPEAEKMASELQDFLEKQGAFNCLFDL